MVLGIFNYSPSLANSYYAIFTFIFLYMVFSIVPPTRSHKSSEFDSFESDFRNGDGFGHHPNSISKLEETFEEMGKPKHKPKNLTCHVCYSETHSDCMDFPSVSDGTKSSDEIENESYNNENNGIESTHWKRDETGFYGYPQECLNESYICSVRKFAFSLSNGTGHAPAKTFALKRNCMLATKCEPGCVVMGERTRIYVCSTCCNSDLCNIGNGAQRNFKLEKGFIRHFIVLYSFINIVHFLF